MEVGPYKERQILGFITGSILVPDFLTPDNVRNNENFDLDGISYKSKEDDGKNIVFGFFVIEMFLKHIWIVFGFN